MPWEAKDAKSHCKDCNPSKWASIANSALKQCQAKGGKDCEGKAIRIANSRSKMEELPESDLLILAEKDMEKELENDIEKEEEKDQDKTEEDEKEKTNNNVFDKKNFHLSFTPEEAIALEQKDGKPISTIQMLRTGKFEHPMWGALLFDEKVFNTFIKNFEAGIPYGEFAIDYRHMPEFGAAGWLKKVFIDKKKKDSKKCDLMGEVEWTPRGEQSIRSGEFKFFSIEYTENYKDSETGMLHGPTILGGGLTNRPFIKKMKPVAMSEDGATALEFDEIQENNEEVTEDMKKSLEDIRKEMAALSVKMAEVVAAVQKKPDDPKMQEELSGLQTKLGELSTALSEAEKISQADKDKIVELENKVTTLGDTCKNLLEERKVEKKTLHDSSVRAKVAEFKSKGVPPAMCALAEKLMLSEGADKIEIVLSEDGKESKLGLSDVITKLFEAIPEDGRVDTGEKTKTEHTPTPDSKLDVDQVQKYADEKKISFGDALVELQKEGKIPND